MLSAPPKPQLFALPSRIEELEAAREYIEHIDFSYLKVVMANPPPAALGWSPEKLAYVEQQYRNWLFLRRKYEEKTLPPSLSVDQFWHFHILDSRSYWRDTLNIFGHYLHHFPYFGVRGPRDLRDLLAAYEETQRLYTVEFGEEIYAFEEEAEEDEVVVEEAKGQEGRLRS